MGHGREDAAGCRSVAGPRSGADLVGEVSLIEMRADLANCGAMRFDGATDHRRIFRKLPESP